MREVPVELLEPLVVAARRVLLAMDPEEVPAALHRIAERTGRRLPPPMARRLIQEIDASEWLRERIIDDWPEADVDASDAPGAASALFLKRPADWGDRIGTVIAAAETARQARADAGLVEQVEVLRSELEQAKRRASRAKREAELAAAEAERRIVAARSSAAAIRDDEREELRRLRGEVAELRAALGSVQEDADATRERLRAIRAELLRARRESRPTPQPPARAVWGVLDPLDAARLLDDVRAALLPDHVPQEDELPLETRPLVLAAGVRPDGAAAIDWLVGLDRAVVIVVDGYNVVHLLEGGHDAVLPMADARLRLNMALADLQRTARRTPRVIVVYDSSQPGGTTRESGPGSVEVRFTAEGHIADEEILMLATELGGRCVVVSTDRRVREGAERVGALGLWSQALADWIGVR